MAFDLNSLSITGRLGGDPEIRYLEGGKSVATVSVAIAGFNKSVTWLRLEAWGKTGEVLVNYARKGHRIAAQGRLQIEEYDRRDSGGKGVTVKLIASDITLLQSKEAEQQSAPHSVPQAPSPAYAPPGGYDPDHDPDIPF